MNPFEMTTSPQNILSQKKWAHLVFFKLRDYWFLALIPIYFLILYWPVVTMQAIPAPIDLALYHAPWSSAIPPGWQGGSYVLSDIMDQIFPQFKMVRDAIFSGDIPFYTNKIQNGVPWLLVSRHEVLNPLMLLPIIIFGPITGYAVAIILKYSLAAIFFIVLMRAWNVSLFASTVGALIFVANAFPVQNLGHGISSMYYYIPFALYGLQRTLEGNSLWTCITPLVLFAIFTSGYPPAVAFHATLYIAFIVFVLINAQCSRRKALIHLTLMGMLSVALLLPILMETYQYLMKDLDFTYRKNYWAKHLPESSVVTLFAPWAFDGKLRQLNWVREAIYYGIFPIFLIFVSFFMHRKEKLQFFFMAFLCYLVLVLFNLWFLKTIYRYIPVLSGTNPNNQTMMLSFVVPVLFSFAWDQFEKNRNDRRRLLFSIFSAAVLIGIIAYAIKDVLYMADAENLKISLLCFFCSIFLCLVWIYSDRKFFIKLLVPLFVLIDLSVMGYGFNRSVPNDLVYPLTPGVKYIKQNLGDGKIFSLDTSMLADTPLWHSIATFGGRGFFTRETKDLYRIINPSAFLSTSTQYLFPSDSTTKLGSSLIDVLNIRFITANPDFGLGSKREWIESYRNSDNSQKYKLVHQGDLAIFENSAAKGRAFLVPSIEIGDAEKIYKSMISDEHDLKNFAWIEEKADLDESLIDLRLKNSQPLDWSLTELEIKNSTQRFAVKSNRSALLVMGDNYHPAIRIRVNGLPSKLLKVDFSLRGVIVPPGSSVIEFRYQPKALEYGLPVMIVAFIFLFLFFTFNIFRGLRKIVLKPRLH